MRIAFAALAVVFLAIPSEIAHALDCEKFLKTHGFLSRAQFQCGFEKYPQDYIEQARGCAAHLSEARLNEGLASGMKTFDDRESEEGRKPLCQRVFKSFPNVFGR